MGDQKQAENKAGGRMFLLGRINQIRICYLFVLLIIFILQIFGCSSVFPGSSETLLVPGTPVLTPIYNAEFESAPGKVSQAGDPPDSIPQEGPEKKPETASVKNNPEVSDLPGGFTLAGKVFLDRDADGVRSEGEPGIGTVRVCLRNPEGFVCTPSGGDGSYLIEDLPGGLVELFLENSSENPEFQFRYRVQANGYSDVPGYYINGSRVDKQHLADTRVKSILDPFAVEIKSDTTLDLALIQGYLTDPFACQDRERISETHSYDLDPAPDKVRNYKGETALESGSAGRTADGHQAVDWGNSNRNVIGTPVRAAAPGIVAFAGEDITSHGNCRMVTLAHPDTGHKTGYVHLDKILVQDGQELKRGQILGTLGETCTDWAHLHFTFNPGWNPGDQNWSNKDPYRDMQDPDSFTWWTLDNQPVCSDFNN